MWFVFGLLFFWPMQWLVERPELIPESSSLSDGLALDGRRRVKNALRSRGYIQGMPEFSSLASNNESIQLFTTHIPFPVPILESKMKDTLTKGSSKLQITSAAMEAATVGVHDWLPTLEVWLDADYVGDPMMRLWLTMSFYVKNPLKYARFCHLQLYT